VRGPTGPGGAKGDDGAIGLAGAQGPIGDAGPQGATGVKGAQGPFGPQGARGPVGPVSSQPGVFAGIPGTQGENGPAGTFGQQGVSTQGAFSFDVPYLAQATVAMLTLNAQGAPGRGDLILTLDAMAVMSADWDGCEMQLKFVVGNYTSFPVSRYMPQNVARHVTYTVALPNVIPVSTLVSVVGSSDCPETRLTSITTGAQWLNRLP
jgi:hypothetical protein